MGTDLSDKGYASNSLDSRFESHLVVRDLLQFQMIVEAIPSCIFLFQGDRLCYVNACAESLTGYSREELLRMPFWGLVHENDQEMVKSRGRSRQAGADVPAGYDIRFVRKNGDIRWVSVRVNLITLGDGPAVMGVLEDITERRKVESQLREDEEYRRLLFERTPIGLALCRMDGEFVDVNPAYTDIIGYTYDETLRLSYWDITPKKYAESEQEQLDHLNETGRYGPYEKEYIHKGGHLIPVRLTGCIIERNGERFIWSSVEDITERKQTEDSLRKLSSAVEQAGESIMITDREGVIEYVNPAFVKISGYSADEVIGRTHRLLKSGKQSEAFYQDMWKTISAGKVWSGKVIDRKKDGSLYPTTLTISPVFTESGDASQQHTHYIGVQSDLTQLESLEHQFRQAQKMEAVGTLVGGIAHDFNNMLAGITGNLYLARKKLDIPSELLQNLDNIEQLSVRAAEMIQQLLTFARKSRVSIRPMLLNPFIREALKLIRTSIPENIAIEQHICSEVLQIRGDATLLHQVMMNLLSNAYDAVEAVDNPRIVVGLDVLVTDDAFVKSHAYFKLGAYAHFSVKDNGCGIPQDQLKHVFDPFFTTKEQGKGTGLGLSMVFGAVKTHHGFVEVESVEGEGTGFHIYLPLLEKDEKVDDIREQDDDLWRGRGETVLLADDQKYVLEIGKEVLEELGYRALIAENGQQAVELFQAHREDIGLCIFDLVMPVMGGREAAAQVRRIDPQAKIIFSTGYDKPGRDGMEHETVISKPFAIEKISRLIRQKLDDIAREV